MLKKGKLDADGNLCTPQPKKLKRVLCPKKFTYCTSQCGLFFGPMKFELREGEHCTLVTNCGQDFRFIKFKDER